MTNEELKVLRADLLEVMKKHGITNASFCGTLSNHGLISLMSVDETQDAKGVFESALNIGRLWQHTRETIRNILDDFEK